MEDKIIENAILDNCNPVMHVNLFKIIKSFEYLDYDAYIEQCYTAINNTDSGNEEHLPILLKGILVRNAVQVLSDIGLELDGQEIKLNEIAFILDYVVEIENMDFSIAEEIISMLDNIHDKDEFFASVISDKTGITIARVYELIEKITISFFNNYIKVVTSIVNTVDNDVDDEEMAIKELRRKSIINKTLHMLNAKTGKEHKLLGLLITTDDIKIDIKLSSYIKSNYEIDSNSDKYLEALDIVSLLVLSSDYRHDMLNGYVDVFENIIDSEVSKIAIFNKIKNLIDITNKYMKEHDKYGACDD